MVDRYFYVVIEGTAAAITEFPSSDEAVAKVSSEKKGFAVFNEASLLNLDGPSLVALYNAIRRGPPIKRFESKEKAVARVFTLLENYDPTLTNPSVSNPGPENVKTATGESGAETEQDMAKKAKKSKKTPKAKAPKKTKSTSAKKAGHQYKDDMKISVLVDKNPKRPTAAAFKRFELYREGMKVSTFLANGGTRADLSWDVGHKFISVK